MIRQHAGIVVDEVGQGLATGAGRAWRIRHHLSGAGRSFFTAPGDQGRKKLVDGAAALVGVHPEAVLSCEVVAELPSDDAVCRAPASTRSIGEAWVASGVSVELTVPSAVTPGERNLMLNPTHPGVADAVVIGEPRRWVLDRRLLKAAST